MGLSPHRRGNHRLHGVIRVHAGSIPAQAGKPPWSCRGSTIYRVYPRTGGETAECGPSPGRLPGLSPHRRGNLAPGRYGSVSLGSIPAQAGKPSLNSSSSNCPKVYPRTGGETGQVCSAVTEEQGLSPHRRGNRPRGCQPAGVHGSIPAQAGKPSPPF